MKRSSLAPLALGLAWLCSLGFVFALGIIAAFAFHLKPGVEPSAGLSLEEREAGALFEQLAGEPLDWGRLRSFSPGDRVPPQVLAMAAALAALPDSAERQVLSYRFFRNLPPSKLEGALEHSLTTETAVGPQDAVRRGILRAWRERDAVGARQFLEALRQGDDAAARAWAASVPTD